MYFIVVNHCIHCICLGDYFTLLSSLSLLTCFVLLGNHSRRLSTDHSKSDRGSRRRKAVNTDRPTCHSVPASPPQPTSNPVPGEASSAAAAAAALALQSPDHDRAQSASVSTAEPSRARRSLRAIESPEPV